MPKLKSAQIKTALKSVTGWKKNGAVITRTYPFKDFEFICGFVNHHV